jgi:hypothetical protein
VYGKAEWKKAREFLKLYFAGWNSKKDGVTLFKTATVIQDYKGIWFFKDPFKAAIQSKNSLIFWAASSKLPHPPRINPEAWFSTNAMLSPGMLIWSTLRILTCGHGCGRAGRV